MTQGRRFGTRPTNTACAGIQKIPCRCWPEARFHPARLRRELLLDNLPASIRLTASPAVGLLVPAADHGGRGVFTAIAAIRTLDGPGRHDLVLSARLWVVPGNLLAVPGVFKGLADAVLIDLVHASADAATDQKAEQRATCGRRKLAAAVADPGAEKAARCPAQQAADTPTTNRSTGRLRSETRGRWKGRSDRRERCGAEDRRQPHRSDI